MLEGDEKCVGNFSRKTCKVKDHTGNLRINGRLIIQKFSLQEQSTRT